MLPIGNSDDVSTAGDQSLLSSRTGIKSRFVMNSSTSSAPRCTHEHEMCLALADNTVENGSIDEVAIILSFLPRKDIMRARQVCTTWRDAAMKTIVPPSDYVINSLRSYNAMRVMAKVLPKLQQLSIFDLGGRHIYSEGTDPEVAAETANYHSHDLNIISNFSKLRVLHVNTFSLWSCPVLFDFPLLESLSILNCIHLKWTLDMLEGLQLLKALKLYGNPNLTGNLSSLRVLKKLESVTLDDNPHLIGNLSSLRAIKDTLEKLFIRLCPNVSGNFMDLADFPRLKYVDLDTSVTGDIRDVGRHDFPALESLDLPKSVHGGMRYEFELISDVPSFMHAKNLLLQRMQFNLYWKLSEDSPDWYGWDEESEIEPPFNLQMIQVGSRLGWSWYGSDPWSPRNEHHSCEINWLDPEPSSESSDFEAYIEDLQRVEQRIDFYREYYEPPTEDEYRRLYES